MAEAHYTGLGLRTGQAVALEAEAAGGSRRVRQMAVVQVSRRVQMVEDQGAARSPDEAGAGRRAGMESGLEEGMASVRAAVPGCNHSHRAEEEELPIGPEGAALRCG